MDFSLKNYETVGPAGQIVRLVQLYTIALARKEHFVLDEETANWWESCFQSRFYDIEPIKKSKQDIVSLLNTTYPNEVTRRLAIEHAANHVLMLNSEIKKPFDFSYYCIYRRGTDKVSETCYCPGILFKEMLEEIKQERLPLVVVSDSQYCINEIKYFYPEAFSTETLKSEDEKPLHLHSKRERIEILRDCLIDCLALSYSNYLIYSHSMMINLACLMNSNLKRRTVESVVDDRLRSILNSTTNYFKFRERK